MGGCHLSARDLGEPLGPTQPGQGSAKLLMRPELSSPQLPRASVAVCNLKDCPPSYPSAVFPPRLRLGLPFVDALTRTFPAEVFQVLRNRICASAFASLYPWDTKAELEHTRTG